MATSSVVMAATYKCPLCESPISSTQLRDIEERVREREKQKLQKQREEMEARFREERKELQKKLEREAQSKAHEEIARITKERDVARKKADEVQRLAEQARNKAVSDEVAKVRSQLEEKHNKVLADKAGEAAKVIQKNQQLQDLLKEGEGRLVEMAKEREHAAKETKKTLDVAVARARKALEQEHSKVLAERAATVAREREGWQKKIGDMQRQLAKRTSNELGDGAEIDLFETLRDAFPDDRITRIGKGERGADIRVDVLHKGTVAGGILIDSKNRKAWQSAFATKLRADQLRAEADHAILSSTAFPSGEKELCTHSGVIVAQPSRVPALLQILRRDIVKSHLRGLSNEKRSEKREALYRFIASEQFRQKMDEVNRIAEQILELDVQEQSQHQCNWKKRGGMVKQQQRALSDIDIEIGAIFNGSSNESSQGAGRRST